MRSINGTVITVIGALTLSLLSQIPAYADSTSPRLAAYYDLKMVLCDQTAYQWKGRNRPAPIANNVIQVGVGRKASYALTAYGRLLTWLDAASTRRKILDQVAWFVAGKTGVFAARSNGSFSYISQAQIERNKAIRPVQIGDDISAASIGDSANYFVSHDGTLFVTGLAHRGQYGDGKLQRSNAFTPVNTSVSAIKAHTGHAILLKRDGTVMGTGGNIYGPLGRHGIGDKAIFWGKIFESAVAIATGSSHSLAIRRDGSLWHWGRDIGLEPKKLLSDVVAAAADQSGSIALLNDDTLWQWERGEPPTKHFQCPKIAG